MSPSFISYTYPIVASFIFCPITTSNCPNKFAVFLAIFKKSFGNLSCIAANCSLVTFSNAFLTSSALVIFTLLISIFKAASTLPTLPIAFVLSLNASDCLSTNLFFASASNWFCIRWSYSLFTSVSLSISILLLTVSLSIFPKKSGYLLTNSLNKELRNKLLSFKSTMPSTNPFISVFSCNKVCDNGTLIQSFSPPTISDR